MLKQITTNRNAVRPTTEIEEAIAQLRDHRMSAPPIAELRMPHESISTRRINPKGNRFGFPVEFDS